MKILDSEDLTNVLFEGTEEEAKDWCWNYHMIENGRKFGYVVQK